MSDLISREEVLNILIEWTSYCEKIVRLWDLSKPTIQDQSDECVDFIFNLVK